MSTLDALDHLDCVKASVTNGHLLISMLGYIALVLAALIAEYYLALVALHLLSSTPEEALIAEVILAIAASLADFWRKQ